MSLSTADLVAYLRRLADRVEQRGVREETVQLSYQTPTERDYGSEAQANDNAVHRKHTGEYILTARWFWKDKPE